MNKTRLHYAGNFRRVIFAKEHTVFCVCNPVFNIGMCMAKHTLYIYSYKDTILNGYKIQCFKVWLVLILAILYWSITCIKVNFFPRNVFKGILILVFWVDPLKLQNQYPFKSYPYVMSVSYMSYTDRGDQACLQIQYNHCRKILCMHTVKNGLQSKHLCGCPIGQLSVAPQKVFYVTHISTPLGVGLHPRIYWIHSKGVSTPLEMSPHTDGCRV